MSDLRNLDLNLLVVFEAVYTTGNITHAATSLGLTQPTISNALSRLRETLDDPLFVREGKGVKPTAKAIGIITPVREALAMIQTSVSSGEEFDPETMPAHFRIVMLDQLEPVLMPSVVRQIEKYRMVTLEMLPIVSVDVPAGLRDRTLDLVTTPHFPEASGPEFETETVGEAKVVAVARKGHPDIDGEFTLEHFQNIGQIALINKLRSITRLDEYLHQLGIERHIVYMSSKFWSFPHILATTNLIGILPGDFAREAAKFYPLEVYPIPFEMPEQQIYQIWKSSRTNDPALKWLREQIRSAYLRTTN